MQNRDNLQGGWGTPVNDQIRTDWPESHIPLAEIGSSVSHPWTLSQLFKGFEKLVLQLIGGGRIV